MEIIKNYRDNKELRDSFNALAEKTFCLNFENWYQNGYWGDKYNPYSIVVDGKIAANVSVNQMEMMIAGERKHMIQLGTVMTDKEYRGRGFIRAIMEEIFHDYDGKCDGYYLFANASVLEFYPKFGFTKEQQYGYSKKVMVTEPRTVVRVPMETKQDWDAVQAMIDSNKTFYQLDMAGNSELAMFYLSQFMKENVYYCEHLNAYIVAEEEDSELVLHAVYAKEQVALDDVIKAFGPTVTTVQMSFVPDDRESYECKLLVDEDTTLFVKGDVLKDFSKKHMVFAEISHA